MKRRNFLQSLAAVGIGAAIVKPTVAEEVKPIKLKLPDPKKVKFVINGRDLQAVLEEKINAKIFYKGELIATGWGVTIRVERKKREWHRPDHIISFKTTGKNSCILQKYLEREEVLQLRVFPEKDDIIISDIILLNIASKINMKGVFATIEATPNGLVEIQQL
jgi:hypothetical protein